MQVRALITGFLLVVMGGGWSFALQEDTEEEKKRTGPASRRWHAGWKELLP